MVRLRIARQFYRALLFLDTKLLYWHERQLNVESYKRAAWRISVWQNKLFSTKTL